MVEFGNNRHDWYTLNHIVYRNTEEKFLKRVICYAGKESKDDSSNKVLHLFSDINRTNVMTKDEVINAFLNGMIIVDESENIHVPISMTSTGEMSDPNYSTVHCIQETFDIDTGKSGIEIKVFFSGEYWPASA